MIQKKKYETWIICMESIAVAHNSTQPCNALVLAGEEVCV